MSLIDSHCHLDFPDLVGDRAGVLARAKASGVETMITISTHVSRFPEIAAIAEAHDNVFCTVGNHPHEAHREAEVSAERLVELAGHRKCVGIGETGLDYHYDRAPRDVAERVFRAHIAAARQSGLPLIVHSRDADDDMAAILREEMAAGPFKGLLHCFTSTRALCETALDLGLYISISGVLTFKNSQDLRDIARDVPLDRLLVETDAPFLAPVPHRGKKCEPAFVADTARALAEVKGVDFATLAAATRSNTLRLFDKMARAA